MALMSELADKQAFPSTVDLAAVRDVDHPGMTYRQWLVGMALQGILSNPKYLDPEIHNATRGEFGEDWRERLALVSADDTIKLMEEGN
jgi:hypothetical protein